MSHPEREPINIGMKLRSLRKSKGVTLSTVSERSGLSISYISKIERDHVRPSFDILHRIVEVLGLTLSDVISEPMHNGNNAGASELEKQAAALQIAFLALLESDRIMLLEFAEFLKHRTQHKRHAISVETDKNAANLKPDLSGHDSPDDSV